ncbi:MAG: hypothetical protein AAF787_21095, partial [Chloroflexota bacterium]
IAGRQIWKSVSALPFRSSNRIYLSREQVEFATQNGPRAGEFIDDVTEFRLLDLNGNALTDFQIWRPAINFDERIAFVEYLGLNEVQAIAPVTPLNDQFALTDAQQEIIASAAAATPDVAIAPAGGSLLVIHDARSLTLVNTSSGPINISGLTVGNDTLRIEGLAWEAAAVGLSASALPPNECLRIRTFFDRDAFTLPAECGFVRSVVSIPAEQMFWMQGAFEIRNGDTVLQSCAAAEPRCTVGF